MLRSATVSPGFAHFISDAPRRLPDGWWYACYRVRRDYGDRSETDSDTCELFKTEGEVHRWYEQEAHRLGFPEPVPPIPAH